MIEQAQRLAEALGSTAPVRVKIDQNGLGHGTVGMLKTWAENGRHQAQTVGVMVSESPGHDDPGAVMRPFKKRDEMWLAPGRSCSPTPPPASAGSGCAPTATPRSSSPPPSSFTTAAATSSSSRRSP
ncbi:MULTISPECIES: hypothetical protein [unclassified Streptomyces]|uniref:hypothetical protein n=1 Tax=unclassified Streptomyces TaxID=2593676 RepID=UPI0029B5E6F8|nr:MULTISPECIES: hypothetical protein [unclassified Streptomyces]MDX3771211.1 hypothetical protein [Streptomyces sp. AK08-01B]MDX3820749.1 hypothetical protein [Streptomyces sp. AK08-01A]